jgi:hypothetical protein
MDSGCQVSSGQVSRRSIARSMAVMIMNAVLMNLGATMTMISKRLTDAAIDTFRLMQCREDDAEEWWQLHDILVDELRSPTWLYLVVRLPDENVTHRRAVMKQEHSQKAAASGKPLLGLSFSQFDQGGHRPRFNPLIR